MIEITFPDGASRSYQVDITPFEIASSISDGLARNIISASFNNQTIETSTKLKNNGNLIFYTWNDDEGKKAFWHSSAHILAQTLEEFYSGIKLTIGPAISNGFYYDVDLGNHTLSEKDFPRIEKRMIEISREKHLFKLRSIEKKEALDYYNKKRNEYKLELINNLQDVKITFCDHDDFSDLCKGGHLPHTGFIKAVKLLNIAGAYWRADQNNKQLTRVYGISFPKQKELNEYLNLIEEAKKRDHRKLGKKLELFTFSNKVGLGLPLWLPKGAELRDRLESFLKKAQKKAGYKQVISPHIGNKDLYETSGHYQKYGDSSFKPISTPADGEEFLLKPMNCPHHCEIYNSKKWSYKELPVRYAEFGTVYRYEQSGELHGLTRVRGFTQDDAHIFCTQDQLNSEFKNVIDLVLYVFKSLGFENFKTQISLRDINDKEKYIGSDEVWETAEKAIINATKEKNLKYKVVYGEAAFYGPKLDFMVKDALGREWQLGTIQVDYNLPERFKLSYIDNKNNLKRPVMIHRAPFGSMERFIAILIEHTGGNFPLWLTSNQLILIPVGGNHKKYAEKVLNLLENHEIRALADNRNETVGKKIREAELNKIPFMIIIGDNEIKNDTFPVRGNGGKDYGEKSVKELIKFINDKSSEEIKDFN
ncbi:MAG: threonine--tRNA ligase [Flavobacteriaceae bacterium]|nr:threonine--tRNA ligase [Flavobacteriaceae bacterium]|tara:strand:- start:17 stop:1960 length:1944 start_codon:yes stop_codon:yes gene_type:complete